MEVVSHPESDRFVLTFPDEPALRLFVDETKRQGAFLLGAAERPEQFARYTITLALAPGFEHNLRASVVQVFEASGGISVAFEVEGLSQAWEYELDRKLRADTEDSGEDSAEAETPEAEPSKELSGKQEKESEPKDTTERTGTSPIYRIRRMNPRERMHLATKAGRVERTVLLRDSSPQVLMALVTNPRVGADDILQIIRNPQASAGVLDRITREPRWLANSEIQKALVRNPKTPSTIVIRLIETLPTEELRQLAKMQTGLKEPLRKAALRVYLKRTSR